MKRRRKPFFIRKPKWQIVILILLGFFAEALITQRLGGVQANRTAVILDLLIFYAGLFLWIFFFAQFVLPVRLLKERLRVAGRLIRYLFGVHGPAIFVENGDAVQRGNEIKLTRPGIALIDSASGAMLRTDTAFTRPVGPGVTFTHHGERLAATVDLRRQVMLIGPRDNEDPFAPQGKDERTPAYEARQDRRWETSALTRDGIEIVPRVIVVFKLQSEPFSGDTPFGYDPSAVQRAATGEGIDPNLDPDNELRNVPWEKLPGRLAINVWREVLPIFTLNTLFKPLPDAFPLPDFLIRAEQHHRPTGLDFVTEYVNQRLTESMVAKLDRNGRTTAQVWSPEYKILHSSGVAVIRTILTDLKMEAEVNQQLVNRWQSTWLDYAEAEREALNQEMAEAALEAQRDARREYAQTVVKVLSRDSAGAFPDPEDLAGRLVRSSLEVCVRDEQTHQRAGMEREILLNIISALQE
jgi:hypothetical protein